MSIGELAVFIAEKKAQYPELREEMDDLFQLALDEIEDGGSPQHECDLAAESINQLIEKS